MGYIRIKFFLTFQLLLHSLVQMIILFALLLRYLIAVPMRQLNESIKKSGENLDFTDSLEYKGCFKELQMLTDANNHL